MARFRLFRLLLSLVILLVMGSARMPISCPGDGHGNACTATSCMCDETCSCQAKEAFAREMCGLSDEEHDAPGRDLRPPAPQVPALLAVHERLHARATSSDWRPAPLVAQASPDLDADPPPPRRSSFSLG